MKPNPSLLFVLAALLGAGFPEARATEFKIATIVPEGTAWMKAMRAGSGEIEQRTGGRVKFKFYTGGVQGNDRQVLRKMRVGQLHGGVFTSGGLGAFSQDGQIYGLPMLFRNYDEVAYVRERMDPAVREAVERAGYVNFGFAGGGFAYLVSNAPIADRASMRGLKVWIPESDEIARRASQALDISSVTLPLTDVLTGLQTDLIDTVMGPPVGVIVMQWHTAMKYITDLPIAYSYAALLIDGKAFSRLSDVDQVVVREVMDAIYREFDRRGVTEDREAFQALLDEGLERVPVPETQRVDWQRLMDDANQAAAREGIVSANLLARIACHLAAFRGGAGNNDCAP
jgi:TRAP-type C4-dicarboxylate transport system substrate-binding protein